MTAKRITVAFFSLLAMFSNVAAQEKSKTESIDGFKIEIEIFLDKWNTAIAKGDTVAIRSAYITDSRFRWFEDGVLTYRSSGEIVSRLSDFPKGTQIETKLSNIDVWPLTDDLAYGSASYSTKISMPSGPFEFRGVFTMLLESMDGSWRFVSGHTSTVPARSR